MKKFCEPEMNVIAFDSDEKIVTSGIKEWEEEYGEKSQTVYFTSMTELSNYANMSN